MRRKHFKKLVLFFISLAYFLPSASHVLLDNKNNFNAEFLSENSAVFNTTNNDFSKLNFSREKLNSSDTNTINETVTTDINLCTFSEIKDEEYTGSYIYPEITLTYENETLIRNKDYEVSYSNNIDVGEAYVIVSGINNFSGTKTVFFNILKAKNRFNLFKTDGNRIIADSLFGTPEIKYFFDKELTKECSEDNLVKGEYYIKGYVAETLNYEACESEVILYEYDPDYFEWNWWSILSLVLLILSVVGIIYILLELFLF